MTRIENRGILSRTALCLLVAGGILALAATPIPAGAQEKKADAKAEKKAETKPQEKKPEAKPQEKKPEAKPQEKKPEVKPQEKKPEAKPAATPAPAPAPDDPAKLKAQVAALQQEVAQLKLKVVSLEIEKLGGSVTVDKGKDGKEIATVNILKKWGGDKDAMQMLKNVPNLQVVYIDNGQVNDAAIAPLKEL